MKTGLEIVNIETAMDWTFLGCQYLGRANALPLIVHFDLLLAKAGVIDPLLNLPKRLAESFAGFYEVPLVDVSDGAEKFRNESAGQAAGPSH